MPAPLVSCVALIACRNEALYLPHLLPGLLEQGIDVVLLDNDSTDNSCAIARSLASRDRVSIERVPWTGCVDHAAVLRAKQEVIKTLPHAWAINIDADEWLQSPVPGERLREGITRVDRLGYNAINFDEFVFLPDAKTVDEHYDFRNDNLDYYFFEPFPQRLMRAWRIDAGFSNLNSGGHKLEGSGLRLAPDHFILRHYIALSQRHIIKKYVGKIFARSGLDRGWHRNRVGLNREQLRLPGPENLRRLKRAEDKQFDRSRPYKKHYWQWP